MSPPVAGLTAQPTPTSSYRCQNIKVEGLSSLGLLQSGGKYFLRFTEDGMERWTSPVVHSRSSNLTWEATKDQAPITCAPTALLRVSLLKEHTSRPHELVGYVELPLKNWLETAIFMNMALDPAQKMKDQPKIKLVLVGASSIPSSTSGQDALGTEVDDAVDRANTALKSRMAKLTDAIDSVPDTGPVMDIAKAWEPLLEGADWFMNAMGVVAEIHPYASMAWSVLSAAYKVVKAQQERDAAVVDLVSVMKDTYAFLQEAQQVDEIDIIVRKPGSESMQKEALRRLAIQMKECADFILKYCRDKTFLKRLVTNALKGTKGVVDAYKQSFQQFREDFKTGSQLITEVVTFRMAADIEKLGGSIADLQAKSNIRDIPYVPGAGYNGEKSCLPGTRAALLSEITNWVIDSDIDAPRLYILMGPAGTGKSAIAHTIASRFKATGQLGAMFCFSTSEQATRSPVALFRNVARELCTDRPPFEAALAKCVGGDINACGTAYLQDQFHNFIFEPSHMLDISGTILIIIDALDESGSEEERAPLLEVLQTAGSKLSSAFRFLITCRPAPDIRSTFDSNTSARVKHMPTPEQDPNLSQDILQYIHWTLSKGTRVLPRGLDEETCSVLRDRAEGLFQWADAACRFIVGKTKFGATPSNQYKKLLAGDQKSRGLDQLYETILGDILVDDEDAIMLFKILLGFVLTLAEPLDQTSLLELMIYLPEEESFDPSILQDDTVLPLLGSVLNGVTGDGGPVRPTHSSFVDFLRDNPHSRFYIGATGHHQRITTASLHMLKEKLHFNMAGLATSYKLNREVSGLTSMVSTALAYSCKHWGMHLVLCQNLLDEHGHVTSLLRDLLVDKVMFWVEVLSVMGEVPLAITGMRRVLLWLRVNLLDLTSRAHDVLKFLTFFARPISDSAAHVYLSALAWAPVSSEMAEEQRGQYQELAKVPCGSLPAWPNVRLLAWGNCMTPLDIMPDGRRFVSADADDSLDFWETATGHLLGKTSENHPALILCVRTSPDGTYVACGLRDSTIQLWDIKTNRKDGSPLRGHDDPVTSLAFSTDTALLVSGSSDSTARIWCLKTRKVLRVLTGCSENVTAVVFTSDNRRVVGGSRDKTIRIWDATSGRLVAGPFLGHTGGVVSVALSSNDDKLISGSLDNTVRMWDIKTGKVMRQIEHPDYFISAALSYDGKHIISCSHTSIRSWKADTGAPVCRINADNAVIHSMAVLPSGDVLYGSSDGFFRLAELDDSQSGIGEEDITRTRLWQVTSLSSDGSRVAAGSLLGHVQAWIARSGDPVGDVVFAHEDAISSIAFLSDDQIVSGSQGGMLKISGVGVGRTDRKAVAAHDGWVMSLAVTPDGQQIISGSDDGAIHFWSLDSGNLVKEQTVEYKRLACFALSRDGSRLVATSDDRTMRVYDVTTLSVVFELPAARRAIGGVAISPDGQRIAASGADRCVRVWDATTGQLVRSIEREERGASFGVAISPDNKLVATGSHSGAIRIWDIASGHLVTQPIRIHQNVVRSVEFSPNGKQLLSGGTDGTIMICGNVGRNFEVPTEGETLGDGDEGERRRGPVWCPETDEQSLCLSPLPEHLPTQPYRGVNGETNVWLDQETGWVMGGEGDHILWVPPEQLPRLYTGVRQLSIPGPMVWVDLSRFRHGTRWTECFTGPV